VKKVKTRTALLLLSLGLMLGSSGGLSLMALGSANAASQPVQYTNVPFTTSELGNWVTDRQAPSGGFSSLANYKGKQNVLEMKIDTANQNTADAFYYTEGLQRAVPSSVALKASLFVDKAWLTNKVRVGLWGVAKDTVNDVSAYPIIEFTTDGEGGFTGWRAWDGVDGGWTNLPSVKVKKNEWNKLEIVYNSTPNKFDIYINEKLAISSIGGETVDFGAVILNNKNYGALGSNYSVHWSKFGYGNLRVKDDCKKDGWKNLQDDDGNNFKNQGQCVSHTNHHDNDDDHDRNERD
jgi:hypothetical protein